ncbi:unnamed protein product [Orchesella dallaii]|uniref:Uncharacterized protein n=1 Tax=Orchesella dallaii TaxID=48710 RepID=A0ABP1S568_9HEXA
MHESRSRMRNPSNNTARYPEHSSHCSWATYNLSVFRTFDFFTAWWVQRRNISVLFSNQDHPKNLIQFVRDYIVNALKSAIVFKFEATFNVVNSFNFFFFFKLIDKHPFYNYF